MTYRGKSGLAAALLWAAGSVAQTNLETTSGVRFNFSPPGAPNLALGGAFIGLADDATAAYTNPAGLVKLLHPEFTAEVRRWEYTHVFTDRGRLRDAPTGTGADTIAGLVDGRAHDQVIGLSFLSYVYPRDRWSFAVYRHELVNFQARFRTFGPYLLLSRGRSPSGIPGELDGRLASLDNHMRLEIVNHGLAAAYRLGRGFSAGLALNYADFSLTTRADRYLPSYEDPPNFDEDPLVNFQTQAGEEGAWSGSVGLRWESARGRLSAGAVYRDGPSFSFETLSDTLLSAPADLPTVQQRGTFHVPDSWGIGLGWRPRDALRIALDVQHIAYSELMRDFIDIFDIRTLFGRDPQLDKFTIEDATEVHLGVEYFFLGRRIPLALLFGTWYDPDHSLVYEGDNEGFKAMFRPRPDQTHVSVGFGFSAPTYQAYLAYDHSDRTRVVSVSVVRRFRHTTP